MNTSASSLWKACKSGNFSDLTPASLADYDLIFITAEKKDLLFKVYQTLAKYIEQSEFERILHTAILKNKLHRAVDILTTNYVSEEDRVHWISFLSKNYKIDPI
jgi:hypothetical protein